MIFVITGTVISIVELLHTDLAFQIAQQVILETVALYLLIYPSLNKPFIQ